MVLAAYPTDENHPNWRAFDIRFELAPAPDGLIALGYTDGTVLSCQAVGLQQIGENQLFVSWDNNAYTRTWDAGKQSYEYGYRYRTTSPGNEYTNGNVIIVYDWDNQQQILDGTFVLEANQGKLAKESGSRNPERPDAYCITTYTPDKTPLFTGTFDTTALPSDPRYPGWQAFDATWILAPTSEAQQMNFTGYVEGTQLLFRAVALKCPGTHALAASGDNNAYIRLWQLTVGGNQTAICEWGYRYGTVCPQPLDIPE